MNYKNKSLLFLILLLPPILFACAPKQSDTTTDTWNKIVEIDLVIPEDRDLVKKGMRSSFFMITPHSNSWRSQNTYFMTYRAMMERGFINELPLTFNERVDHYVNFFTHDYSDRFERWLIRSQEYMPRVNKILKEQGMPGDLAYLPLIESGYNPHARSRRNAVGMWQFIKSTAKIYGLRVDSWVDERKDVEKSTLAASMYLKDMYDDFGSWELALAGYNCGNLRVQEGMIKTNSNDYWKVNETLPRETKNYVPKYLASLIIAKNPDKYGFPKINLDSEHAEIVKVSVPPKKHLADIAKLIDLDPDSLKSMNPSLINGATPPGGYYEINVPSEYSDAISNKSVEIASLKDAKIKTRTITRYRVRNGESLWTIARKFGVNVSTLKRANRLSGNLIRTGQTLSIPRYRKISTYKYPSSTTSSGNQYIVKPGDTLSEIAEIHGVGLSKLKSHNGLSGTYIKAGQKLSIPKGKTSLISHKVRKGDTLWDLASKYRVSIADIKQWNNLKSNKLVTGDSLRIYR